MTHGDDRGIITPPRLAPTQVVVVPIWRTDGERASVLGVAARIRDDLQAAEIRVEVDEREGMKPGAKYYEWEGRGVPLRLEVGPRDVAGGQTMAARRTGGKDPLSLEGLAVNVRGALAEIQQHLFDAAVERRDANSHRGATKDVLMEVMQGDGGFVYGGYCGSEACETAVKDATKATIRVLPDEEFRSPEAPVSCLWCGETSVAEAVWAKAY